VGNNEIVYNRPDCPYGCGAALAPNLRWQGTPCQGCGRPLFPLTDVVTDGAVLWPPPRIPGPPENDQPDVQVWFVVGEEDALERRAISNRETQRAIDKSDEGCLLVTIVIVLIGGAVAAVAVYLLVLAPH
jgi:hypothetical protein